MSQLQSVQSVEGVAAATSQPTSTGQHAAVSGGGVGSGVESVNTELEAAVNHLRAAAGGQHPTMEFQIDRGLGRVLVLVHEQNGPRVLREISNDEVVRLARLVQAGRQQLIDLKL